MAGRQSRDWALVTGASGGIGEEMARQLALRGWAVVLHGRDRRRLMTLAGRLGAIGADVRIVTADLARPEGAHELIEKVDQLGIAPKLLVNNAGLGYAAPFVESDLERQRALVQLDVVSVMELAHEYGRRMALAGGGAILNVASVAATMPGPGMATYYASKAFVLSLSEALHEELAPAGVRVLAVCPGPVLTGFWAVAGTNTDMRAAFMLDPEVVCRIALVALDRDRAVCAPGLVSKACYAFGRSVPGVVARKVAGLFNQRK